MVNDRPTIEISFYDVRLENNVVLDWISKMDKYFEYESKYDNKKVKVVVTKSKGHDSLWWDHSQTKTHKRRKEKIKTWVKMKKKFLRSDYQVNLLINIQNLRQ